MANLRLLLAIYLLLLTSDCTLLFIMDCGCCRDNHLGLVFESLDPLVALWRRDNIPFVCRTWSILILLAALVIVSCLQVLWPWDATMGSGTMPGKSNQYAIRRNWLSVYNMEICAVGVLFMCALRVLWLQIAYGPRMTCWFACQLLYRGTSWDYCRSIVQLR